MQAHRYPEMLGMILDGRLEPGRIVTRRIAPSEILTALPAMAASGGSGITVVDRLDE